MHVWLKSIIIIVLDYCTFVQLLPFVRTFEGKIQCFETILLPRFVISFETYYYLLPFIRNTLFRNS